MVAAARSVHHVAARSLHHVETAWSYTHRCTEYVFVLSQDRLQHVLADLDPVDLSHVMWAVARLDSYPAPGLLDALLATLPPQISSAEPGVCCPADLTSAGCMSLYGLTQALQMCCRHCNPVLSSASLLPNYVCMQTGDQADMLGHCKCTKAACALSNPSIFMQKGCPLCKLQLCKFQLFANFSSLQISALCKLKLLLYRQL